MSEVDTAWFKARIAESPYGSIRGLAQHMRTRLGTRTDHGMVSRMVSGEREILLHEARQLADLLGQPMSEIIRRAGIPFGARDNLREPELVQVLVRKASRTRHARVTAK